MIFVVSGGKNKYGGVRKHWREFEYAQAAIGMLYPEGPPIGVNQKRLTREVNNFLAKDPQYRVAGFGEISLREVRRALEKIRNHP